MNSNENTQPLTDDAAAEVATPKRRHRRNLLIGLGAAVALVAMGGGAYAVGNAAGDDDHDRGGVQTASGDSSDGAIHGDDDGDDHDDHDHDDRDDDRDRDDRRDDGIGADRPASDAASLRAVAEQAIAHVNGEGVTSIEIEHGGYEIDVRLGDGREADVFVSTDGNIRTDDDDDDDSDDPLIDLAKLGDILAAAQSAAADSAGSAGVFESISTDDDSSKTYEIELRLDDDRDVEVELAGDLKVVSVDIDD